MNCPICNKYITFEDNGRWMTHEHQIGKYKVFVHWWDDMVNVYSNHNLVLQMNITKDLTEEYIDKLLLLK
jgi:hypothetical protein